MRTISVEMNSTILDGKKVAEEIKQELKKKIQQLHKKPSIAVILVGNNPASELYIKLKTKACQEIGINCHNIHLPEQTSTKELRDKVEELNENEQIDGFFIQLPLPEHIAREEVLNTIDPKKDIDGQTATTLGKIMQKNEELASCTAKGIIYLLERYKIQLKGKHCVIINHSTVIGRPLAEMLLNREATVTICHKATTNLKKYTQQADILITATGVPGLITNAYLKEGVIVIDAGIATTEEGVKGDFSAGDGSCTQAYTPVPGGVGPMTIAMLLKNAYILVQNRESF